MRRSIRYVLSAVVGLAALALAVVARDGSVGVLVATPFVYGVTAALVLDRHAPRHRPGHHLQAAGRREAVAG